jgi:hypothetical protein
MQLPLHRWQRKPPGHRWLHSQGAMTYQNREQATLPKRLMKDFWLE